ncbi:hypothetical protein [Rhizobium sp.]|jgi:hypothetical protein|uniref:hypothetical protein n=1 Tax=Rhizobium sp. TaxID=391 RepID=UPI000E9FF107|nr:hypothetical protein [Rhizobium sp.]
MTDENRKPLGQIIRDEERATPEQKKENRLLHELSQIDVSIASLNANLEQGLHRFLEAQKEAVLCSDGFRNLIMKELSTKAFLHSRMSEAQHRIVAIPQFRKLEGLCRLFDVGITVEYKSGYVTIFVDPRVAFGIRQSETWEHSGPRFVT